MRFKAYSTYAFVAMTKIEMLDVLGIVIFSREN
jgi:hypothetical protein